MLKPLLRRKKTPRITFLSLPNEVKNVIYQLAAQDLTLSYQPPRDSLKTGGPSRGAQEKRSIFKVLRSAASKYANRKNHPPSPPSLLLASKQCRNEVHLIMLAQAKITIPIRDFDFRPIGRMIQSSSSSELEALRDNENLRVVLFCTEGNEKWSEGLEWWAYVRAAGRLDGFGWHYCVGGSTVEEVTLNYLECSDRLLRAVLPPILAREVKRMLFSVEQSWSKRDMGGGMARWAGWEETLLRWERRKGRSRPVQ
ncbi:unnamed protein product [Zymoseptoria tritici ST99CH_1E4]|uniref:F-box domain-containing protein n=1 Tax=Zymoseptoria tritici ST99CH_1E4 TaxID=1276532 RepID=A0A2H1G3W1_ZYMTR|nr:unnamed protein product [Zymoseptoria tritici ST99CH_1E4]